MAITFPSTQRNILITGYSAVTPCTMADIYNADIAAVNGRQLYTGAASGSPFSISLGTQTFGLVTTQPWVADSHGVQLKITCTARAGATLALTGKNRSGETVTETGIDISSGSAITIKKYFTLDTNGIVFTGLSNGDTITIKQDRWGVVSKIQQTYPYCVNTKYWMCEGGIQIGDYSSTPGNFASTNELFFFPGNHGFAIGSNPAGSFVIGSLSNGLPSEGSVIVHDSNGQNSNAIGVGNDSGITGNITIYDTAIKHLNRSLAYGGCYVGNYGGTVILKGIHANGCVVQSGAYTIDDICIYRSSSGGIGGGNGSVISNARVHNSLSGYSMAGQGLSDFVTGVVLDGTHSTEYLLAYAGQSPTTARLNDCVHGDNKIKANGPSNIYRTTYVDILINDILGNPISGAACLIKDMDGNIVSYNLSISTNAITVLSSAIDIVASTSWLTFGFAVGDVIVQDAEFMLITAIGGTGNKTATVTRGYYPKYPAVYHYSRIIYKAGSALSNASGFVPQQIIPLKRYLQQQGGIEGAGLATTYKDHTIIISKQGYSTYQDVITFAENDLTGQDLEISLSVYPNINFYTQSNQNRIGGNIMDIKKNEADATKRRVPIVCVDAADFATPEPGEAGGQAQKSINKGVWTNTAGTLVLVDAASGSYYVEYTQAEVNGNDLDTIDTRYKSANTAYTYGPTVQIKAKGLSDVVADIAAVSGQVLNVEDKVDLIDNIVDSVKTETDKIAGVKAKTDNIPVSPATEGNVSAVGETVVAVGNAVVTIDGIVDAIKAKTDNLPDDPASDTNVNANEAKIDTAITNIAILDGKVVVVDGIVDTIVTETNKIAAIKTETDKIAGVQADIATLDDKVVTVDGEVGTIDALVDAIKAKTDNLPTDPASDTNVNANEAKIDTAITNLATLDGKVVIVDGIVDAIKTETDKIAGVKTDIATLDDKVVTVDSKVGTIDALVDAIKAKTDNLPVDPASDTNVNANEVKIDTAITNIATLDDKVVVVDGIVDEIVTETNKIAAIKTETDKIAGVKTDIATLDDKVGTMDSKVETIDALVDAIKAKTDNLPADPASDTNVNANETKIDAIASAISTLDGKVVTLVSGVANNSRTVVDSKPQEITRGDEVLFTIYLSTSWNLTGKKVHFMAKADKDAADSTAIFNVVCTVGAASGGLIPCTYTLTPAQTAIKGKYYAEAEVRNTDGSSPQTAKEFPLIIRNDVRKG